jgi:hypothetical protein
LITLSHEWLGLGAIGCACAGFLLAVLMAEG